MDDVLRDVVAHSPGAYLLRRTLANGEVEFSTFMLFAIDHIREFNGTDYEVAHVLARFDQRSAHSEAVVLSILSAV